MLPAHPDMLGGGGPLVLVDDELSTGTTAANTIEAVHARYPRHHYVVASLIDVRCAAERESMAARVAALGARRTLLLPARQPKAQLCGLHPAWPGGLPDGGRHGFALVHRSSLETVVADIAVGLTTMVRGRRVLVLGCEEFMYVPLRVAQALQRCLARGSEVHYASTARSRCLPSMIRRTRSAPSWCSRPTTLATCCAGCVTE